MNTQAPFTVSRVEPSSSLEKWRTLVVGEPFLLSPSCEKLVSVWGEKTFTALVLWVGVKIPMTAIPRSGIFARGIIPCEESSLSTLVKISLIEYRLVVNRVAMLR